MCEWLANICWTKGLKQRDAEDRVGGGVLKCISDGEVRMKSSCYIQKIHFRA